MPGHILLTPLKWFQEIGHYPAINVDGRDLKVSCALAAAPDLLLSNNAELTGLAADLGILVGEQPIDKHGNPLKQGIGCFYCSDSQAPRDDLPGMLDPLLDGWFYLKPDSYAAVWDQVRDGGYGCSITLKVGPVQNELPPKVWDVSQALFILAVSLRFTRRPIANKPANQAARPVVADGIAPTGSWVSFFKKIEVASKQKWHA